VVAALLLVCLSLARGGDASTGTAAAAGEPLGDEPGRQLRQRPARLERRRQIATDDPLAAKCVGWDYPAECRRKLPCDLRSYDPGAEFNRGVLERSRPREWATNNVDAPNRYFQNGVEWWLHRALPAATPNVTALDGADRVFIAAYWSYMFIFAPHKVVPLQPLLLWGGGPPIDPAHGSGYL